MNNTENNVAAQAGDEPMRAVVALAWKWHDAAVADGFAASEPAQELFALLGWPDRGVSPRATADVERNLRAELINAGALRQYCHNDGSAGFVTAYDFDITNRFLAAIATTKPGA